MLIKQVVLRNIRSYESESISVPEGIVLLSGDIGSGKSTILLAIEFALFGLLKGDVAGAGLLRNGANEGSVELLFDIDGKEYRINRSLKRASKSIKQDAGFLEVDGVRAKLTPLELKSKILELIGYPAELITKSKALIYRYTVYTPQEDMKRIIEEDREERLRMLRSVFDVERYQRIKANASLYAKGLRSRISNFEGQLIDFEIKKKRKRDFESELEVLQKTISDIVPKLKSSTQSVKLVRDQLSDIEKVKDDLERHTRELHVMKTRKESLFANIARLNSDISGCSSKIEEFSKDIVPVVDVKEQLSGMLSEQSSIESEMLKHQSASGEFSAKRKFAQDTALRIRDIAECPTCFQKVPDHHKTRIIDDQKKVLRVLYEEELAFKNRADELNNKLSSLKSDIDSLREKDKAFALMNLKVKNVDELKSRLLLMQDDLKRQQSELAGIESSLSQKAKIITDLSPRISPYPSLRLQLDSLLKVDRDLAVEHARISEKVDFLTRQINILVEELNQKELAKLKLEKINENHAWLDEKFIPLMSEIERHVMVKIHEEFNDTFKQWFGMLIDDNLMTAELDDSFSPIITQNGFETDSAFLSGGEKTACALAYRLALNRTINSLLNTVRTKDLLILDEPTDGFSDEQLDKMRDVLEDLSLKQIILVSHEQKIESFADHVLRVQKNDHMSRIIS